MHLTLYAHNYWYSSWYPGILIRLHNKADLLETNFNSIKYRKVCVDENLGKNGHDTMHTPSGLGSRLIVVIRK